MIEKQIMLTVDFTERYAANCAANGDKIISTLLSKDHPAIVAANVSVETPTSVYL